MGVGKEKTRGKHILDVGSPWFFRDERMELRQWQRQYRELGRWGSAVNSGLGEGALFLRVMWHVTGS